MDEFNGILSLNLVTIPNLKTIKTNDGGTAEFYEMTLSDGKRTYNNVIGSKSFNFASLQTGKSYPFLIVPQFKSAQCISAGGKNYNRTFNTYKVVGVASEADIKKFISENFSK